jgi:CHAD domain-containing protein
MRVTTRRLQASLDLLQFGKQEKKIKRLKRHLRRWRRKLSKVRNYDVFLMLLDTETARQKTVQKSLGALQAELHHRRDHLADEVRADLEKARVDKLAARLGLALVRKTTLRWHNHRALPRWRTLPAKRR